MSKSLIDTFNVHRSHTLYIYYYIQYCLSYCKNNNPIHEHNTHYNKQKNKFHSLLYNTQRQRTCQYVLVNVPIKCILHLNLY